MNQIICNVCREPIHGEHLIALEGRYRQRVEYVNEQGAKHTETKWHDIHLCFPCNKIAMEATREVRK